MPLEAPTGWPDSYIFFEELIDNVNSQAKDEGFAIVKRCTYLDWKKAPRCYNLVCDKGGYIKEFVSVGC